MDQWNDDDRVTPTYWAMKPVPVPLCPPQPHMDWSGIEYELRGKRPVTNVLSRKLAYVALDQWTR